jgi:hypothetical protein
MLPLYNKEIAVFGFFETVWLTSRACVDVWYQTAILALIRYKVRDVAASFLLASATAPEAREGAARQGRRSPFWGSHFRFHSLRYRIL